jgi:hypothetical protein
VLGEEHRCFKGANIPLFAWTQKHGRNRIAVAELAAIVIYIFTIAFDLLTEMI